MAPPSKRLRRRRRRRRRPTTTTTAGDPGGAPLKGHGLLAGPSEGPGLLGEKAGPQDVLGPRRASGCDGGGDGGGGRRRRDDADDDDGGRPWGGGGLKMPWVPGGPFRWPWAPGRKTCPGEVLGSRRANGSDGGRDGGGGRRRRDDDGGRPWGGAFIRPWAPGGPFKGPWAPAVVVVAVVVAASPPSSSPPSALRVSVRCLSRSPPLGVAGAAPRSALARRSRALTHLPRYPFSPSPSPPPPDTHVWMRYLSLPWPTPQARDHSGLRRGGRGAARGATLRRGQGRGAPLPHSAAARVGVGRLALPLRGPLRRWALQVATPTPPSPFPAHALRARAVRRGTARGTA